MEEQPLADILRLCFCFKKHESKKEQSKNGKIEKT